MIRKLLGWAFRVWARKIGPADVITINEVILWYQHMYLMQLKRDWRDPSSGERAINMTLTTIEYLTDYETILTTLNCAISVDTEGKSRDDDGVDCTSCDFFKTADPESMDACASCAEHTTDDDPYPLWVKEGGKDAEY